MDPPATLERARGQQPGLGVSESAYKFEADNGRMRFNFACTYKSQQRISAETLETLKNAHYN